MNGRRSITIFLHAIGASTSPPAQRCSRYRLERTDQAIPEGRDALRLSTTVTKELARAVTALGAELASDSARFHVVVESPRRNLHPMLRHEVYAIAREAVRNAFRHAQARNIEAEITYNESSFKLRIRES